MSACMFRGTVGNSGTQALCSEGTVLFLYSSSHVPRSVSKLWDSSSLLCPLCGLSVPFELMSHGFEAEGPLVTLRELACSEGRFETLGLELSASSGRQETRVRGLTHHNRRDPRNAKGKRFTN